MSATTHAQWSSRMGFVLAATGSAVGLGNIWKFPYMVGQSGGAAFVLVYLVCIALIGVPILVAEWMIGRRGQKNPINTMAQLAREHGHHRSWALVGGIGVLAAFLILSFYSVIGGWSLAYVRDALTGSFTGLDKGAIGAAFDGIPRPAAGTVRLALAVHGIDDRDRGDGRLEGAGAGLQAADAGAGPDPDRARRLWRDHRQLR
ncbi:hypothetical protein MASR2M16_15130 [Thauera terpenica]